MANLKDRLRQLRKQNNLTQQDVATFLGITESAYGYYEQGRNEPSLDRLKMLANKYDVSLSYISGDASDSNKGTDPEPWEDPELGLWFKELKEASPERQEELKKFWELLKQAEKGRKPEDKQGE